MRIASAGYQKVKLNQELEGLEGRRIVPVVSSGIVNGCFLLNVLDADFYAILDEVLAYLEVAFASCIEKRRLFNVVLL